MSRETFNLSTACSSTRQQIMARSVSEHRIRHVLGSSRSPQRADICSSKTIPGEQEESRETFPGDLYQIGVELPGEELFEASSFALDSDLSVKC